MKIEDFELEILKTEPGDIIVIKFPMEKYPLDEIYDSFESLKRAIPEGVELMMMPVDFTVEIQNDNLH